MCLLTRSRVRWASELLPVSGSCARSAKDVLLNRTVIRGALCSGPWEAFQYTAVRIEISNLVCVPMCSPSWSRLGATGCDIHHCENPRDSSFRSLSKRAVRCGRVLCVVSCHVCVFLSLCDMREMYHFKAKTTVSTSFTIASIPF